MGTKRFRVCFILAASLLIGACVSSPLDEQRRLEREQAIDDILSFKLDPAEYGETVRCLSSADFDSVTGLDDRHLLVRGRRDRLWVNTLRGRCLGLDKHSTLIIEKFGSSQTCRLDRFEVYDSFAGGPTSGAVQCVMGDFQPVTQEQVDEIEAIIDAS